MATHILTYAYNLKTQKSIKEKSTMENQQHDEEETRHLKFKTLNTYTKILRTLGKIVGGIACIPLAIGSLFLFGALLRTAFELLATYGFPEEAIPPLVKSLTFLGISDFTKPFSKSCIRSM